MSGSTGGGGVDWSWLSNNVPTWLGGNAAPGPGYLSGQSFGDTKPIWNPDNPVGTESLSAAAGTTNPNAGGNWAGGLQSALKGLGDAAQKQQAQQQKPPALQFGSAQAGRAGGGAGQLEQLLRTLQQHNAQYFPGQSQQPAGQPVGQPMYRGILGF